MRRTATVGKTMDIMMSDCDGYSEVEEEEPLEEMGTFF